jgi:hypothetical protein
MLVNTSSRVVAGSRDLAWKVGIRYAMEQTVWFSLLWIVFILVDLARKILKSGKKGAQLTNTVFLTAQIFPFVKIKKMYS